MHGCIASLSVVACWVPTGTSALLKAFEAGAAQPVATTVVQRGDDVPRVPAPARREHRGIAQLSRRNRGVVATPVVLARRDRLQVVEVDAPAVGIVHAQSAPRGQGVAQVVQVRLSRSTTLEAPGIAVSAAEGTTAVAEDPVTIGSDRTGPQLAGTQAAMGRKDRAVLVHAAPEPRDGLLVSQTRTRAP